jgi:hypothetical protein
VGVSRVTTTGAADGGPPSPEQTKSARHYRTGLRRRRVVLIGLVVVTGVGVGTAIGLDVGGKPNDTPMLCTVSAGDLTYSLLPDQLVNAATISSEAAKAGLPDHAVTVALATAMQESKLRNLTYGDRDSLGLFQQRPSQGWGTPEQLVQPTYASAAFYQALAKIPSWETLDVATAAQRVQRSADGSAYTKWEPEARALATALTGQKEAGLACSGIPTAYHESATAVASSVTAALGASALSADVPAATGWKTAAFLVANAGATGVTSVSYAGQTWTSSRGTWRTDPKAGNQVTFTVAQAPATS